MLCFVAFGHKHGRQKRPFWAQKMHRFRVKTPIWQMAPVSRAHPPPPPPKKTSPCMPLAPPPLLEDHPPPFPGIFSKTPTPPQGERGAGGWGGGAGQGPIYRENEPPSRRKRLNSRFESRITSDLKGSANFCFEVSFSALRVLVPSSHGFCTVFRLFSRKCFMQAYPETRWTSN